MKSFATMVSLFAVMASALVGCAGEIESEDQADASAIGVDSAALDESTGTAQQACGHPLPPPPPCFPPPCFPPRPYPPPCGGWGHGGWGHGGWGHGGWGGPFGGFGYHGHGF
jgi:hypothetical protein